VQNKKILLALPVGKWLIGEWSGEWNTDGMYLGLPLRG
jgi:hypothetical protein